MAITWLAVGALMTGCALPSMSIGDGPATPCVGDEGWPPAPVRELGLPEGVIVEPEGGDTIAVTNRTRVALQFELALWTLGDCTGWIAADPLRSRIEPGHTIALQGDPLPGTRGARLGVAVYEASCDDTCGDPPIGFGWMDISVPAVPS
jgi:hypothetical protein